MEATGSKGRWGLVNGKGAGVRPVHYSHSGLELQLKPQPRFKTSGPALGYFTL